MVRRCGDDHGEDGGDQVVWQIALSACGGVPKGVGPVAAGQLYPRVVGEYPTVRGPGAQLWQSPESADHRGQIGRIYPRASPDQPSDARIRIPPISIVPDVILLRGCSLRVSRRRRRLLRAIIL
jgi:hypothetical protein